MVNYVSWARPSLRLAVGFAVASFSLLSVLPLAAQRNEESGQEASKARAAEEGPSPSRTPVAGEPAIEGPAPMNPLFAGVDSDTVPAYQVHIVTGATTMAFTGVEVWGAAWDADNDQVYIADGSDLHVWSVGGGVPTLLGTVTDGAGGNLSMVALGWYDGTLYAYTASQTEGIWSIDPGTQVGTLHIATVAADTDCGGLSVDQSTGTFYCTSDDTSGPGGAGLYVVNGDGSLTFVTAYPAGETDVDGLAVGDGIAYLVTDDDTPPEIYVYDLGLGAYQTSLPTPFIGSAIFSGAAYIQSAVPVELQSFSVE